MALRLEGAMIRCGVRLLAFATLLAGAAGPARADVLEVGAGGYAWITGRHAAGITASAAAPDGDSDAPDQAHPVHNLSVAPVPARWAAKVAELSHRFDLSPSLIEALVWQESRWQPNARSAAGAEGLAQLMPGTARELGVDRTDPFANLEGGARYLRRQLDAFGGDVERALAAYNAGPGRVRRANGVPRIAETRNYVAAIFGRLSDPQRR